MNRDTRRQAGTVVAVAAMIAVNALANALPLNGQKTGQVADRFDVFFTPAGYVFSIWGLIYLGLAAFAVFQALPAQRTNERLRRVGWIVLLSAAANAAWLVLWHHELFLWSLLDMLALLVTLIAIYLRLGIGRGPAPAGERWLVRLPFSIYLGWITVATIANATVVLDHVGWSGLGLGPEVWTVAVLAVAVTIGAAVSLTRGDLAYGLVLVWAFVGIAVKHPGVALVAPAAWIAAAAALALAVVGALLRLRRQRSPSTPAVS
jgi:benzodiazapine receptor